MWNLILKFLGKVLEEFSDAENLMRSLGIIAWDEEFFLVAIDSEDVFSLFERIRIRLGGVKSGRE